MAGGEYAKYVKELIRPDFVKVQNDAMLGKITEPPLWFNKSVYEESPLHVEIFMVFAPGAGFGLGRPINISVPGNEKLLKGMPHKQSHDELFLYVGTNPKDNSDLGGETEFWLGEGADAEKFIINKPTGIYVPKNVVHHPTFVLKVDRPFFIIIIATAPVVDTGQSSDVFPPGFTHEWPKDQ